MGTTTYLRSTHGVERAHERAIGGHPSSQRKPRYSGLYPDERPGLASTLVQSGLAPPQ